MTGKRFAHIFAAVGMIASAVTLILSIASGRSISIGLVMMCSSLTCYGALAENKKQEKNSCFSLSKKSGESLMSLS